MGYYYSLTWQAWQVSIKILNNQGWRIIQFTAAEIQAAKQIRGYVSIDINVYHRMAFAIEKETGKKHSRFHCVLPRVVVQMPADRVLPRSSLGLGDGSRDVGRLPAGPPRPLRSNVAALVKTALDAAFVARTLSFFRLCNKEKLAKLTDDQNEQGKNYRPLTSLCGTNYNVTFSQVQSFWS